MLIIKTIGLGNVNIFNAVVNKVVNMIILKLTGGLGNQMFQYAYARSLQEIYKEPLYLDCTVYKKYKIRSYSLSNLNISGEIKDISNAGLNFHEQYWLKYHQFTYRIYQKLYKLVLNTDATGENNFIQYSKKGLYYTFDRHFYPSIKVDKKIKSVYGYFPSEKYFLEIKDNLKQELLVKTPPSDYAKKMIQDITKDNAVGVSIRCGEDYLNSQILNICNKQYYYNAMDEIASKVKDPVFYIFSDDINKVKREYNFKYKVIYVDNQPDYESLRLLYSCKHFIISNSTFSWFGAYLSQYEQKIVVAPKRWFNNSVKTPDIYLESMTIIEV